MQIQLGGRKAHSIKAGLLLTVLALPLSAQQAHGPDIQAQRDAMQKLGFLVGHWSGPVSIMRGPGEPLKLTQAENVQLKLDGLVMLIEGQSTGSDGKPQFQALATIAYDDATHAYRIRAYNGGRYLDTELTVQPDGFSWGFDAGPAKIRNTMQLTAKGEWQETTDVTFGSAPSRPSVQMLLKREP
jgi:hypothetical protein